MLGEDLSHLDFGRGKLLPLETKATVNTRIGVWLLSLPSGRECMNRRDRANAFRVFLEYFPP